MMLPLSNKDVIRFTPPSYSPEDDKAPVYLLSVPTKAGRAKFHREMAANNCRFYTDEELIAKLKEGINTVVEPEQRPQLMEVIDLYELYKKEKKETLADLKAEITNIERSISAAYQPYAEMTADRLYYLNMYPVIATALFMKGWENIETKFVRNSDRLSDETLNAIPESDLNEIGMKIMNLMTPTGDQEKN